jgi:hypothetical protein
MMRNNVNNEKRTKIAIGDVGVLVSMPRDVGKRSLIFERMGVSRNDDNAKENAKGCFVFKDNFSSDNGC